MSPRTHKNDRKKPGALGRVSQENWKRPSCQETKPRRGRGRGGARAHHHRFGGSSATLLLNKVISSRCTMGTSRITSVRPSWSRGKMTTFNAGLSAWKLNQRSAVNRVWAEDPAGKAECSVSHGRPQGLSVQHGRPLCSTSSHSQSQKAQERSRGLRLACSVAALRAPGFGPQRRHGGHSCPVPGAPTPSSEPLPAPSTHMMHRHTRRQNTEGVHRK